MDRGDSEERTTTGGACVFPEIPPKPLWSARRGIPMWRRAAIPIVALLLAVASAALAIVERRPDNGEPHVVVISIEDVIERGLVAYVDRVMRDAEVAEASAVVLRVNTPGGRLDSALEIKDRILDSGVPVMAFIDRHALSAGALISLAATNIYMVDGALFGAATPVVGDTGEKASEKVVSAVRAAFAATAEHRGRDPLIARAMVDEDVAVEGLVEQGKLLTFTTRQALEWGYADAIVTDLRAALEAMGLGHAQVEEREPALAEALVRFLANPVTAGALVTFAILGFLFEFAAPGWGIGGTVGLICLGLFFWSHMLVGLAGWEGVLLVAAGILLIALEILVIPGTGIAGIAGLAALLGGIFISLIGDLTVASSADLAEAGYVLLSALALILLGSWGILKFLPQARLRQGGLVLAATKPTAPARRTAEMRRPHRAAERFAPGAEGVAVTDLRPSGTARLDGQRVSVVTEGDYVEAGSRIVILYAEGNRVVVRGMCDRKAEEDPLFI